MVGIACVPTAVAAGAKGSHTDPDRLVSGKGGAAGVRREPDAGKRLVSVWNSAKITGVFTRRTTANKRDGENVDA